VVQKDGVARPEFLSLADQKSFPIAKDNADSVRSESFSPDGLYLAFDSTRSGDREVYVQSVPPGNRQWKISTKGGDRPRWRRDGRELYYHTSENAMMAVDITPGPKSNPITVVMNWWLDLKE
jgi:Tol biopolymer transport system component